MINNKGINWINLAQDGYLWWDVLNTVMNLNIMPGFLGQLNDYQNHKEKYATWN
jgi:hypothetical protein